MERSRSRRRQVDLFNFSFLDILACVIGLLIFILTIVVISGGGPSSAQTSGRLAAAERQLQGAQEQAQLAADRRSHAESLLGDRAQELKDPQAAADLLRGEIRMLYDEREGLVAAASQADARLSAVQAELRNLGHAVPDPKLLAGQTELRSLDQETADWVQQADEARNKAPPEPEKVAYYTPHLRETDRRTFWMEVSGGRTWCVKSADYLETPIDEKTEEYQRLDAAVGTSISALVQHKAPWPTELAGMTPGDTVIELAVRPDGYAAFRQLRQWAWNQGFSVNWVPMERDETLVLTQTHRGTEQ